MINLKEVYQTETGIKVNDYYIYNRRKNYPILFPLSLVLMLVIIVFYTLSILDLLDIVHIVNQPVDWFVYESIALLVLLFTVYQWRRLRVERLLVTKTGLAYNKGKKVIATAFESIKNVNQFDGYGLMIETTTLPIHIDYRHYPDALKSIEKLFAAQGHFNETPYAHDFHFSNDMIVVEEILTQMDPKTEFLLDTYRNKYRYINVGYIEDLLFYNVQIERMSVTNKTHASIYLSHIDVKANHPENTKFKAQKTDKAMLCFQDVTELKITGVGDNAKTTPNTLASLRSILKNAVLFETTFKERNNKLHAKMALQQDIHNYLVQFTYSAVITGWNALEEDAWFEK